MKKIIWPTLGAIVVMAFLTSILYLNDIKEQNITIKGPDQEISFAKIVQKAIDESKSTSNEAKRFKAKNTRTKELCSLLKNKQIKNWYGLINKEVSTTISNEARLSISLITQLDLVYKNKLYSNLVAYGK